jgi:tellurite resistance protein TerC
MVLFPFAEYWSFYLGFLLFVLAMLSVDLGVFHRQAREVTVREASLWTALWIFLALLFNLGFYFYTGSKQLALEFLTGFVVEKSLAIDNIFVFAIVFSYFAIPKVHQHRVLFFGVLGALIFRGLFIAMSSYLMAYREVVIFFGVLLIFTGIKMLLSADKAMEPERSWILKLLRKLFRIDFGSKEKSFFILKEGKRYATPLFIALLFIEFTDILFAIDSVPAIFALTHEPFIVFTSNVFAILGLRSMYFLLAGAIDQFQHIKYGLAAVLVFVGLKMAWLNEAFGGKFPVSWSLGIIALFIGASIGFSLFQKKTGWHRAAK